MTVEIFHDQISMKECCQLGGGVEPATSWSSVGCASNWATEAGNNDNEYHIYVFMGKEDK